MFHSKLLNFTAFFTVVIPRSKPTPHVKTDLGPVFESIKGYQLLTEIVYRITTEVNVFSRISKTQMFSLSANMR